MLSELGRWTNSTWSLDTVDLSDYQRGLKHIKSFSLLLMDCLKVKKTLDVVEPSLVVN